MSKGTATFNRDKDVPAFLALVKQGWKPHSKTGVKNPHKPGETSDLFGKMANLTAEEVAEELGETSLGIRVTAEIAENIRKSAENVMRKKVTPTLEAQGKDPKAYRLWFKPGKRGRGSADPNSVLDDAGISMDDLL